MVFAAERQPHVDVVRPHCREHDGVQPLRDEVLPDLGAFAGVGDVDRLGGEEFLLGGACRSAAARGQRQPSRQ